MKRKIYFFLIAFLFLIVFPSDTFAANSTIKVFIFEPSDTNPGGFDPEYQGTVTVTCNGINRNAVFQGGYTPEYHAIYSDVECPPYKTISAFASNPEGETGSGTGTMLENEGFINFNLAGNISVPEFGFIPGLIAVAGSTLGFLKLRKNK